MSNKLKMKIAIDIDGVLANIYDPIFKFLGRNLTYEDVRMWDFFEDLHINRQEFWETYKKIWSEDYELIPLIEDDAPTIISKLKENYEIHIMTSRPKETFTGTIMWLQSRHIEYDGLILLPPSADKTKMLSLDNYLCLVDDNPAFVKDERVILFDQPWNQGVSAKRRIKSLRELLDILPVESSPPQRGV